MKWISDMSNPELKTFETWILCSTAVVLVLMYIFVLVRTLLGTKSRFVITLVILLIISNIAFIAAVIVFNKF